MNKTKNNSIENKRKRLKLYYEKELYMLSPNGVKSYGIGSRNLQRYDIALKDIQSMIKTLENEIAGLEAGKPRRAVAVVLRDF